MFFLYCQQLQYERYQQDTDGQVNEDRVQMCDEVSNSQQVHRLSYNIFDNLPKHIRQAERPSLELVGELFMIEVQLVQNSRL